MRRDIKGIISVVTALAMTAPYVAFAADPPGGGATAEPASQDVLFKNGSKARGQVVDIVPGDHVTIKLKNGEMRRFEWKDVDRVVPASGPEPPPLPTATATPVPTTTTTATAPAPTATVAPTATATGETLPPVNGPTAKVHINSPNAAILFRKAAGMTTYQKACDAPCDLDMPLSDDYQISGSGLKAVNFRLNAQAGQTVIIDCEPSSDGGKIGGILLIVLGAVTFGIIGLTGNFVALILQGTAKTAGEHRTADDWTRDSLIIDLVGIAIGVGGIVLLVKSGDSNATQRVGLLNGLPDTTKIDDRYVRVPVWSTPVITEKREASGPTPLTVPIFSRSF